MAGTAVTFVALNEMKAGFRGLPTNIADQFGTALTAAVTDLDVIRTQLALAEDFILEINTDFEAVARGVDSQRVGNERPTIEIISVNGRDVADARFQQLFQHFFGYQGVAGQQNFTARLIHYVVGDDVVQQVFPRYIETLQATVFEQAYVPGTDTPTDLDDDFAGAIGDIE